MNKQQIERVIFPYFEPFQLPKLHAKVAILLHFAKFLTKRPGQARRTVKKLISQTEQPS